MIVKAGFWNMPMNEILPLILCGIFVVLMLAIIINFTLESWKSDQEYNEAIRKIYNGDYDGRKKR